MNAEYEIWLDDPYGRRLMLLDRVISLTALKVANNSGAFKLVCPDIYDQYIRLDYIIEVWRKPPGGTLALFNAYFIRTWKFHVSGASEVTTLSGPDGHDWAKTRIVDYAAGTANADKSAPADDMAKAYVRENLGSTATNVARDCTGFGLTVAPDLSDGPTLTLGFARRKLPDVLKEIGDASKQAGTSLYFDFTPVPTPTTLGWEFRTAINQPGQDRTGTERVIFGRKWGNMEAPEMTFDYSNESTIVYAGGQGQGSDRVVNTLTDTVRQRGSPRNRRETFTTALGLSSSTASYDAAGNARLHERRPRLNFSALFSVPAATAPGARYGVDWGFGDRVIVDYRDRQYEAVNTSVELSTAGGKEAIKGTFEVVE